MNQFLDTIEDMCGQKPEFSRSDIEFPHAGLGFSQLNEVLLILGLDRISDHFFAYLSAHKSKYESGMVIESVELFREAVENFQKHALMRFGNIKFAFKKMRRMDEEDIKNEIEWDSAINPSVYTKRHNPSLPIREIISNKTYLLGYLVNRNID